MIELNDKNFKEEIAKNDIILVDFWADWCVPCKMLEPTLIRLESCIQIGKVDIDLNMDLSTQFSIKGVPTMLIFKNGELVKRYTGVQPYSVVKSFIDSIKQPKTT